MKRLIFTVIIGSLAPLIACAPTDAPSVASQKITLDDATTVLDISSELPARFERLDASSEGMSNKDLGLGSDFTEVELFMCAEPFQYFLCYYTIVESRLEQAASDAFLKDEEQVHSTVVGSLRAALAEEGIEIADVTVNISHPVIGDLAVLGLGVYESLGMSVGYDILAFKVNKVYVFVVSYYLPGEHLSTVPLGKGIEQRVGMFSQ